MTQALHLDAQITALNDHLASLHLEGHWKLIGSLLPEPTPFAKVHVWRWADIRSALLWAGEIHSIDGGGRRTVRLCTPGLDTGWATPTIHASVQMVKPAEIAAAHRHSMSALRFVVEGSGGYTTVNGVKLKMEVGDLILTPGLSWHDHGNDGQDPVIWVDGHDFPLVGHLRAQFNELYNARSQEVLHNGEFTRRRAGALRPAALGRVDQIPYVYKASEAIQLLHSMDEEERDSSGAYVLDYVNPLNGGPTMPTINCRLHRIPAKTKTKRQRRTANGIFVVVDGEGATWSDGAVTTWRRGDIFVVPGWTWHQHEVSSGGEDAVLFSMSDDPVLAALGLLRTETAG